MDMSKVDVAHGCLSLSLIDNGPKLDFDIDPSTSYVVVAWLSPTFNVTPQDSFQGCDGHFTFQTRRLTV